MNNLLQTIVNWCQPLTVIVFIIAGIAQLILKNWQFGLMNVTLAWFNFLCFYGHLIFKK